MSRTDASRSDIVFCADVLVLGGGPAGAWAASTAAALGASVVLADKGRVGTSGATASANTAVIDVPRDGLARRSVVERRLRSGLGLARADWIEDVIDEAHAGLSVLADWGYRFPRDDRGERYRGTLRGPDYMQVLRRRLGKQKVRLLDHSPGLELLLHDGAAAGACGMDRRSGKAWTCRAGAVVLATGGCAFMSKALGTYGLTGDGLLMGVEAGATLSGLEFSGQYGIAHSAASVTKNLIYDWATFSDVAGRELVGDDKFELLARYLRGGPVFAVIDKASPAIQEALRGGQPNIFLPLDRQGIDPFTQRFPVTLIYEGTVRGVGGLVTDRTGATTIPGLFAAGDAASREPLVGAVSGGGGPNSTWAIASGAWAGQSAATYARSLGPHAWERSLTRLEGTGLDLPDAEEARIKGWIDAVQREMLPLEHHFLRDRAAMTASMIRLDKVWREIPRSAGPDLRSFRGYRAREAAAMAATARWIMSGALARAETRGIHRRRDCVAIDPGLAHRLRICGTEAIRVEAMAAS